MNNMDDLVAAIRDVAQRRRAARQARIEAAFSFLGALLSFAEIEDDHAG